MRGYQFLKNSGEVAHWLGGGALGGGGDHQRARNGRIHDAPDSQTLGRNQLSYARVRQDGVAQTTLGQRQHGVHGSISSCTLG